MHAGHSKAALFVLITGVILGALPAMAQGFGNRGGDPALHGVPPSVTSPGFGGRPGFHGIPPSVTSPGFGQSHLFLHRGTFEHRRHHEEFLNPYFGGYYAPYAIPYDYGDYGNYVMDPGVDDTMEEDYGRTGPTIFDSHGFSDRGYAAPPPPGYDYRSQRNVESPPAQTEPAADQPATVLVFKDGRQVEVINYAIVGTTLYDLSNGRSRKVALAELDLSATVKQNDDRGIEFKLPAGIKAD